MEEITSQILLLFASVIALTVSEELILTTSTRQTVSCPGRNVMMVEDTYFGNEAHTCRSTTIHGELLDRCFQKRECTIDKSDLTNPCGGLSISSLVLTVTYVCVDPFSVWDVCNPGDDFGTLKDVVYLTTPDFPAPYPIELRNGRECEWTHESVGTGKVNIQILYLQTESRTNMHDNGCYDNVYIYDDTDANRYCGDTETDWYLNAPLSLTISTFRIHFDSDGFNNMRGFLMKITNIPGDPCDTQPCINGGSCESDGDSYTCTCVGGYIGEECTIPDPCHGDNVCENGATCSVTSNNFAECKCAEGFTGSDCSAVVHPCEYTDIVCIDGDCDGSSGDAVCVCHDGFTGQTCEIELPKACDDVACENGYCNPSTVKCVCDPGYMGDYCDVIDPCNPDSPCENHGSCVVVEDTGVYACECTESYTGTNCNIYDTCSDEPCQHEGVCEFDDSTETHACQCTDHYIGDDCSVLDKCAAEPCKNQGTCVFKVGDDEFRCLCLPMYTGILCESETTDCAEDTCSNGGTCSVSGGALFCECPDNYKGDTCDECDMDCNHGDCDVDPLRCVCDYGYTADNCSIHDLCTGQPCKNGADCIFDKDTETYTCECVDDYIGQNCTVMDQCADDPCLNGGSCTFSADSTTFTCQCPSAYDGETCEEEVSDCRCLNGGRCSEDENGVSCECLVGFTGENCQDCEQACENGGECMLAESGGPECKCPLGTVGVTCEFLTCQVQRCDNGGTCNNIASGYNCSCTEDWKGPNCEYEITNNCYPDPCGENGTCEDDFEMYICICEDGYTGTDCQEKEKTSGGQAVVMHILGYLIVLTLTVFS